MPKAGATYQGEVDSSGWSPTLEYIIGKSPIVDSQYVYMGNATWFTTSYWTVWRWAKKYTNLTSKAQKLTRCSFQACTAHSNGSAFKSSNGRWHIVYGAGCDFYCDVYLSNSSSLYTQSNKATLPPINTCNASSGGVAGKVTEWGTIFGSVDVYGAGRTAANGQIMVSHTVEFTFANEIIIQPGESMYMIIQVPTDSWNYQYGHDTTYRKEGIIVIENVNADPTNWETDIEPVAKDMIWVMTSEGWKKERSPYQWDGKSWVKMEG